MQDAVAEIPEMSINLLILDVIKSNPQTEACRPSCDFDSLPSTAQ